MESFSIPFYKWLLANSTLENRQRITNILLHPHVRSLQVRAALGRRNWSSLYADLPFEQFETTVPNVAAVYFLNGRRYVNANGLHQDIGYVGQAARRAAQKDGEGRGAAKRLGNHGRIIRRLRAAKVSRRSGARRYSLSASEGRREDQREVQGGI